MPTVLTLALFTVLLTFLGFVMAKTNLQTVATQEAYPLPVSLGGGLTPDYAPDDSRHRPYHPYDPYNPYNPYSPYNPRPPTPFIPPHPRYDYRHREND